MLAAAFLAFTPAVLNDGDTSWHVAAGRYILEHARVPHQDPFSFTFRGQPWTAHEWLTEVVMAVPYRVAGWAALSLLTALAVGGALLMIGRELGRYLPPRYLLLAVSGVALVLAPATLARPHALVWPLLTLWTLILLRARARDRPPPAPAALLMLLWANMHASFVFGLALIAVFATEALVESEARMKAVRGWGGLALLSLLAACLTPFGIHSLLYPFQVSGMRILPLIAEWRPTRLPDDLAFVALASAVTLVAVLNWRKVGPVRLVLIAVMAGMAAMHSRHQPLFAIVGTLAILPRLAVPRTEGGTDRAPVAAAALIGAVAIVVVRLAMPFHRPDMATYPGAAIAATSAPLRSAPVVNSYSFGGPLILNGIAPFIDGRSDMYGDSFTFAHARIVSGNMAEFREAEQRWGIRWTILATGAPLIQRLDHEPGWRRLYTDRWAVVHVRAAP